MIAALLAVLVLASITFSIVFALGLESPWLQPWAIVRAAVQLGALSLVLNGIITSPIWVGVFLAIMVGASTWVVFRRLRLDARRIPLIAGVIAVSAAVPVSVVFATSAVEFSPRYLLAVGGIVIGGAMTVSTLMGRSLSSMLLSTRDEIEGWLALGATPRRAAQRAVRSAASTALIPSTDQTRTTGIVTLPGAFVGAVFAGASPLEAAEFQVLVLAAILTAGSIAIVGFTWAFGAPKTLSLESKS